MGSEMCIRDRPILFNLPPETAWHLSDLGLSQTWFWKMNWVDFKFQSDLLASKVAGLPIKNPVGLAAGYDKNCKFLSSLEELGFGYVMGGTVTKDARPGNPKPRVIRLKDKKALINALGFPGNGLDNALSEVSKLRNHSQKSVRILSVSGTDISDISDISRHFRPFPANFTSDHNPSGLNSLVAPRVPSQGDWWCGRCINVVFASAVDRCSPKCFCCGFTALRQV